MEQEYNSEEPLLYTHEEIDLLVKSFNSAKYNEDIVVRGMRHLGEAPVTISFHDAGHILGSASILIRYGARNIFYTGDIKLSPQSIMKGAQLPEADIDTILTESTYCNTASSLLNPLNKESVRFAKECNKIIQNGGAILVPVFALGKTQEILAMIHNLIRKGTLTEVPIYTGGLGPKINRIYDKNRYLVERNKKNLELSRIEQYDLLEIKDYQHFVRNPGIVLASSGMLLENTTSYRLVKFWLKQINFGVFFVGYIDEDSPGYPVLTALKDEKVKLTSFEKGIINKSKIEKFNFPSHSTREELLNIIAKYEPDNVIILHGEEASRDWLGYNILKTMPSTKVFAPSIGSEILL